MKLLVKESVRGQEGSGRQRFVSSHESPLTITPSRVLHDHDLGRLQWVITRPKEASPTCAEQAFKTLCRVDVCPVRPAPPANKRSHGGIGLKSHASAHKALYAYTNTAAGSTFLR